MKEDTDWNPTFVLEFDTLLFELKLLSPALPLLFALLPTMSFLIFFFIEKDCNIQNEKLQTMLGLFVECKPKKFVLCNQYQKLAILALLILLVILLVILLAFTIRKRQEGRHRPEPHTRIRIRHAVSRSEATEPRSTASTRVTAHEERSEA